MISKLKTGLKNIFSSWKATLAVALMVAVGASITIVNMRKTISVVVDGQEVQVKTLSSNLRKILNNMDIKVDEFDKVSVALDSKVKNKDKIYIKKAVNIDLKVDGQVLKIKSAEDSIEKMLLSKGVKLNEYDKILPEKSKVLQNGMTVQITRVDKKIHNEVKELAFNIENRENNSLPEGREKVIQEGQKGEKEVKTEVIYENGKEVSRKVINEKVVKQPINKIIDVGTLGILRASRGSEDYYGQKLTMTATAYTADRGDDNGITALGTPCVRDSNGYSTIAVDPNVIPLGTKVYIEGYGYAIAQDTGGAIKGNIIDVYFNSYDETINWGRRPVTVYILK